MDCIMYLRKSRADGTDDIEDTLRRHKETLLTLAAEHEHVVHKIYEEVVSGDSLYSRPEMIKLLEDIEHGNFHEYGLLCMDIDRLGRGAMSDQGIILEALKAAQIKIITPRKVYDLNNELDEEYTEFETFMARRELKLIKRRMQRGTQKTIEEGGYVANPPYGYERDVVNKRPTLKIVEEEAAFVRMIFDMYVNQRVGCQTIADTINAMGAKPHRSNTFNRTSVLHILKNPAYCGKIVWNKKKHIRKGIQGNAKHITIYNPPDKWNIYQGIHPAIIDDITFQKASQILKNRYRPHFTGVIKNPLAGIVYCSKCGQLMQRRPYNNGDKDHLICVTRGCCSSSRLDYVIDAVIRGIQIELGRLQREREANLQKKAASLNPAIESLQKELKNSTQQKSRLHEFLEQGVYDTQTYLERMKVLNDRITATERSIEELREKQAKQRRIDYNATIAKVQTALDVYGTAPPEQQNEILKGILDRVYYYKEKGSKPRQFRIAVELKAVYTNY